MLGSTLALFLYHAKWSPGHFGSRSSPLLFKSSWSPLGPGNMAQWGQQAQQGDRRGWGGRDRGDRDQWTGGRSGGGGGGYGAHNPYEVQLPKFLTTVVTTDDKDWSSIMMVDKRDDRLVSPFQAWLVSEIMANSASSINVLTERDQVMPPNSGFHLSLFANYFGRDQGCLGGVDRFHHWFNLWWMGSTHCKGIGSSGFSAILVAYAQGD